MRTAIIALTSWSMFEDLGWLWALVIALAIVEVLSIGVVMFLAARALWAPMPRPMRYFSRVPPIWIDPDFEHFTLDTLPPFPQSGGKS